MTRRLLPVLVPLGVSLLLAFVGPAGAATVTVSTANDSGAGSLRASIAAALPGDTISFDPILNGQTITLTGGEIAITKALILNGPGAASLSISGNRTSRI